MRNRFIRLMNSPVSEWSMLVIIFSMLLTIFSSQFFSNWQTVSLAVNIVAGAVLIGWLAWSTYVLATKKSVREMRPKPRLIVESISRLLLVVWFYLVAGVAAALILLAFIVWSGYLSLKEVLSHTS